MAELRVSGIDCGELRGSLRSGCRGHLRAIASHGGLW